MDKTTSSEWSYHNPTRKGDAPAGVNWWDPSWEIELDWVVGGEGWSGGKGKVEWLPDFKYRYRPKDKGVLILNAIAALPSLPDDADKRNALPMADGLLDYFPNALAEVAALSCRATKQHHPDQPMHWDRSKSTDHRNKIMRHLVDTHTVDDKGNDHWAMVCWRALAGYQEYLEAKHNLPPSRASRNVPSRKSETPA